MIPIRTLQRARALNYTQAEVFGAPGVYLFGLSVPQSVTLPASITMQFQVRNTNAPGLASVTGINVPLIGFVTLANGTIVATTAAQTLFVHPGQTISVSLVTKAPIPSQYAGQSLTVFVTTVGNAEKGLFSVTTPGVGYDIWDFLVSGSSLLTATVQTSAGTGGTGTGTSSASGGSGGSSFGSGGGSSSYGGGSSGGSGGFSSGGSGGYTSPTSGGGGGQSTSPSSSNGGTTVTTLPANGTVAAPSLLSRKNLIIAGAATVVVAGVAAVALSR